jgi:hypothetical protein
VLWAHGRGRVAGWSFTPSPTFIISPPDPSLPSKWCVQWQIYWGNDGQLSISRQVKPAELETIGSRRIPVRPMRIGYFSAVSRPARWNPLPPPFRAPRPPPGTSPIVRSLGHGSMAVEYPRTKPSTTVRFLRAEYFSSEQEFAHFPGVAGLPEKYVSHQGGRSFLLPLLYLFILFAVLPCVWSWRTIRDWRGRCPAGHCPSCAYNLTGNRSGVCPECGMALLGPITTITTTEVIRTGVGRRDIKHGRGAHWRNREYQVPNREP